MKRFAVGVAALLLTGCVMPGIPGMPMGMGSNPEEAARMSATMQQAQAAGAAQASRPGDEAMDCAAIQAELMAQMQDPQFQAALGNMTAGAKDQKARQDAAQARGASKPGDVEAGTAFSKNAGTNMAAMMPQVMRGQRLNELATAKKCAFLNAAKPA
jgi:hypothetical protein